MQDRQIITRDFCCERDRLVIRGREFRPQGESLPAMIVSHGFGGDWTKLEHYCLAFAAWGYAVYGFDFCGGGSSSSSDGDKLEMTIHTECKDLSVVLDYVHTLSYINHQQILLVGESQGGLVSALIAAQRPDEVKALVLLYPALCIPDDARRGALAGATYDINNVPEVIHWGDMMISRRFHETVVNMDPFEAISPYQGKVLILHGTADPIVDYHYVLKAKQAYQLDQCQMVLIENAGHGFTKDEMDKVLYFIKEFCSNLSTQVK